MSWAGVKGIPVPVAAALGALRFSNPGQPHNAAEALDFLDRNQLTLVFGHICDVPALRERFERNLAGNRLRLEGLRAEYETISAALDRAGVEHTVLKGFSHGRDFLPDPTLRAHYDLDLLVSPDHLETARRAISELGFEAPHSQEGRPIDHAAPMVRKTDWQWRNDYFDPDIPAVVELHYRTWDRGTEGFQIPELSAHNRFTYAAAHALRHLLRGNLKAFHIYEMAYFLHNGGDTGAVGPHQAIICDLARRWFSCDLPGSVSDAVAALPPAVRNWLECYWSSPIAAQFRPNKDELWLHFELASGAGARRRIARRRLFPSWLPDPLHGVAQPPASALTRTIGYAEFLARRAAFHLQSLARFGFGTLAWAMTKRRRPSVPRA